MRHRGAPETIERALFGQAGFLDNITDAFPTLNMVKRLKRRNTLSWQQKYGLERPKDLGWKMSACGRKIFPTAVATLAQDDCARLTIGYDLFAS